MSCWASCFPVGSLVSLFEFLDFELLGKTILVADQKLEFCLAHPLRSEVTTVIVAFHSLKTKSKMDRRIDLGYAYPKCVKHWDWPVAFGNLECMCLTL